MAPNTVLVRPAEAEDASHLAQLFVSAAEGIALEVWAELAEDGQSPVSVGEARARRQSGGFSYRKAWIADVDGQVAGMGFGYVLLPEPDDASVAEPSSLPPNAAAWAELEREALGSFFINGLAVYPKWRGLGLGRRLLTAALDRARLDGCSQLALTVFGENATALNLYRSFGFSEVSHRPPLKDPKYVGRGDLLLMMRDVDQAQPCGHSTSTSCGL